MPIWFSSLTSRGSLAGVFRNASCWAACFSCFVGGCDCHLLLRLRLRLVRGHALGFELLRCLVDRLLLGLLLLLLDLVQLLLVGCAGLPSKSTAIRSGPLMPGPKPLVSRS